MPVLKYRPNVGSPWQVVGIADEGVNFSNPNLLDNWYFGNPVDQRQGYVIPLGVQYRRVSDYEVMGTTDKYYQVASTDGVNPYFYVGDVLCYVAHEEVATPFVRGYTSEGYTIDRWNMVPSPTGNTVLLIEDDYIRLISGYVFRHQVENAERFAGKTVTVSMLLEGVATGTGQLGLVNQNGWVGNVVSLPLSVGEKTVISTTVTMPEDTTSLTVWYYGSDGTDYKVYGAKLELGTQQTLAHQDVNDNWVLNEIPDYGEQLRRCQRYFYKVHYAQHQTINAAFESTAYSFLALPIPVNMRVEKPSLTQSVPITLGTSTKTMATAEVKGCMAILGVNYDVKESYANSCYAYCPTADGVTFTLSADL